MESLVKQRIKAYLRYKGISQRKFEAACGMSNGYINNILRGVSVEKLQAIGEAFPDFNTGWLMTGEGLMIKRPEADGSDLYPELPLDAAAGFTDDIDSGIVPSMCRMLPKIPDLPDYEMTIAVRGDSMYPTFMSGDRLAIRRIPPGSSIIQWGAPHVLDTTEGIYVKRIEDGGEFVRCISDNPAYHDMAIRKDEVRGLYRIVGMLRICG